MRLTPKLNRLLRLCKNTSIAVSIAPLVGCVYLPETPPNHVTLNDFTTDGCSLFPDGSFEQPQVWCHCCIAHDKVYWSGGTKEQRRDADLALKQCVATTGHPSIAHLMWLGVRAAGSPNLSTSFRWGYGWPYLRPYQALSIEEEAMVKEKMQKYENGQLK